MCEAGVVVSVDVVTETAIDRPVAAVAAYTADPSKGTRLANLDSVEWKTAPPLEVGSAVGSVARSGWIRCVRAGCHDARSRRAT